jgi:hypothetical protein
MFTIDLLNGKGIPVQSGPQRIAVAAAALAPPVVVAMIVVASYLSNSVAISVKKRAIANCETMTGQLAEAIGLQKSFEQERKDINGYLAEVSTSLGRHAQWSPVLDTLADSLPASLVLTRLEVKQDFTKVKVPTEEGTGNAPDITVPVRKLQLSVCGGARQKYEVVREFRDRLRLSKVLGPRLQDIIVAQKPDKLDGQDVVSYEINCLFRPGL